MALQVACSGLQVTWPRPKTVAAAVLLVLKTTVFVYLPRISFCQTLCFSCERNNCSFVMWTRRPKQNCVVCVLECVPARTTNKRACTSLRKDSKQKGRGRLCLTQVDRWRHAVSDVLNTSPLKKLLESIFSILPVFIRQWEIQTHWVYTGWLFIMLKLSSWKKDWTSLIAFINWEFLTGCLLAIINRTRAFRKFKMAARQTNTFSTLVLKIGTTFLTAALRKTEDTPHSADQLPQ
jgi:hypothetical protein